MPEQHNIILGNPTYQDVSDDVNTGQIRMAIRFFWDRDDETVTQGHFRLRNMSTLNDNYSIIKAQYCPNLKRIEVHIASHEIFNDKDVYTLTNVDLTGLKFVNGESNEFVFRVSQNSTGTDHGDCENVNLNPDDKDGSILIGTR